MTDEQRKRVHDITYSTQDREELAERIVRLENERDLYSSLVEDMDNPDTANQLRAENAKLQDENARLRSCLSDDAENARQIMGENAKLRELVAHLMYVKPNDVNAILYKGELLRFEDLLAEVGMRWESEVGE